VKARYWTEKCPSVNAFDTETRHGDLLLICDPKEHFEVRPGTQFGHVLNFLFRRGKRENFFWNVSYDEGAILKGFLQSLSPKQIAELRVKHKFRHNRFTVILAGDKGFRIRDERSHREKRYWDLTPFYSEEHATRPLDEVAREKLGEGKFEDIDRRRLGKEDGYYAANREKVIGYCKQDALLVRKLAVLRIRQIGEALGFYPTRYASKASVSKAFLDRHYSEVLNAPVSEIMDTAFHRSYKGGIFHTRVLGRVENVTEIDISSAYPSVIAELPDLRRLKPEVSRTYHPEALLGAYLIEVEFRGDLPLVRGHGRRTVYPTSRGPRPYWATLPELRFLIDTGRQPRILASYEFFGAYRRAFPGFDELYERRQALKQAEQDDLAFLLKIVMSACYGAFAESKHGETRFTNWVYAATITGAVRARIWTLWDLIGWNRIVSINTDSIRFVGPSPGYESRRAELTAPGFGSWEEKYTGATVTHYQSGVALIEREGQILLLRQRGFKNLTPAKLKHAMGPTLTVERVRPIKLGEALAQDRLDDLGDFQEEERTLDLRSNLHALDFPDEKLTFEYLNRLPLEGANPDYDEVAFPRRMSEYFRDQGRLDFRGQGGRNFPGHRAPGDRLRPPYRPEHQGVR